MASNGPLNTERESTTRVAVDAIGIPLLINSVMSEEHNSLVFHHVFSNSKLVLSLVIPATQAAVPVTSATFFIYLEQIFFSEPAGDLRADGSTHARMCVRRASQGDRTSETATLE